MYCLKDLDLNKEEYFRNIRAHRNLDYLDYSHKMINFHVLHEILNIRQRSTGVQFSPCRMLDVGCGTGYLLKRVLKKGWNAHGIDPFPRGGAAQYPLKKYIIEGEIGDLEAGQFNVISAVEVVEHVEDYLALLEGISNLLHPDGEIFLTVPNNWEFRYQTSDEQKIEPMYGHLWKFTMGELKIDLQLFFDEVKVRPIYSRTMDRRLLRFTRLIPLSWGRMISEVLVNNYNDGGWLLAVAKKKKQQTTNLTAVSKASAKYYKDPRS